MNNYLIKERSDPKDIEEVNFKNIKVCSKFETCSYPICPLDLEMLKRVIRRGEGKCPYLRKKKENKINGKVFISGGKIMPECLLNLVPMENKKGVNKPL